MSLAGFSEHGPSWQLLSLQERLWQRQQPHAGRALLFCS
jgi:hypothetical protein